MPPRSVPRAPTALALFGALGLLASCNEPTTATRFRVLVTNVSAPGAIVTSTETLDIGLSPGVYLVSPAADGFFTVGGNDRGEGLESLAEEGNPVPLSSTLDARGERAGIFEFLAGTYEQGAIGPSASFSFEIEARPGDVLHLATMFGQSNDHVFATQPMGIALFDGTTPREGDASASLARFDVGTESDEPLGEGAGQPGVGGPGAGTDVSVPVSEVLSSPTAYDVVAVHLEVL